VPQLRGRLIEPFPSHLTEDTTVPALGRARSGWDRTHRFWPRPSHFRSTSISGQFPSWLAWLKRAKRWTVVSWS